MTTGATKGHASAVPTADWSAADESVVGTLRDLIRIPSINPPDPDAPDGETRVARYLADRLAAIGLAPEVVEPVPGRGSVHVRLRGDGTGGEPFLLMSHLDVVPAPPERWTHDPFAADIEDGYVYGRGAVDMKGMVALELGVIERLVAEARAAGRDPGSDPIPGLRRDVLFTCAADEEAGSTDGARWFAAHRPDWLQAAAAVNECGGVSITVAGRRLYPIQVAEKGFVPYRIHVTGNWGHGSMPREDNAAVIAAGIMERLAVPGPIRVTPVMTRFLEAAADALPREHGRTLRGDRGRRARAGRHRPGHRRAVRPDVRPRAPGPHPRHVQPERGQCRRQVQRHPGRRDDRRRLPPAARDERGRHARRGRGADRAGRPAGVPDRATGVGRAGRGARRGPLLGHAGGDAPGPRPGRRPAAGHGPVRDRRQGHRRRSARRRTASPRSGSSPTSGSSSASTASTSASRSTRCGSGSRSSTTSSAGSAAEAQPGSAVASGLGAMIRTRS